MVDYERVVYEEVREWERKIRKKSSLLARASRKVQGRMNAVIPEKVHHAVSEAIKNMVKVTLSGAGMMTRKRQGSDLRLEEKDKLLKMKLDSYRKTAVVEGAGTGAGGLLLGLADFPLLLSIKMKFLFEAASVYGYDTEEYEERLFLLYVFQLAFSGDETRRATFEIINSWEEHKKTLKDMDWREFQQEYRDYIDLVKMAQLLPGIGAVVGAYANYNLLDQLGETAMNAYRLRLLKTPPAV